MSHLRYMVFDNRKHRRPIPDVDRAVRGIKSFENAPPRAWRDASRTKVVAASSYVKFGLWWGFVGGGSRSGLRYVV